MKGALQEYESFLESLQLYPELFKKKTVEMDLKGALNPSYLLDDYFFKQKNGFHLMIFMKSISTGLKMN